MKAAVRPLAVDRTSSLSLTRQLYMELSSRILSGELGPGERLPATRELAAETGVSRNVAMEAYEQLAAEGFLLGISGAGTFVADRASLGAVPRERGSDEADPGAQVQFEAEGSAAAEGAVDFLLGRPALDLVPYRAWSRIEREAGLASPAAVLGGAPAEGLLELREALAAFLRRRRGIDCGPEEILITTGALHGLALLADSLLEPGAAVLFEDPGDIVVSEAFRARGARILPSPVDEEGIVVEALPRDDRPAMAFVTPSHQFPLGGCLSVQRRIALVDWARESGCLLVEDDYESEYRYDVGPVSSLQRLDPDNVVYVGTFSKIFYPSVRLGYLVLPERLVAPCLERKRITDRYCAPLTQLAMARFIGEERLDRHIARMRKEYRRRRDALAEALESSFGDRVRINGLSTGLHLAVAIKGATFDRGRVETIRSAGAVIHPVEDYALAKGKHGDAVAMGYSHLSPDEIAKGVQALAKGLA